MADENTENTENPEAVDAAATTEEEATPEPKAPEGPDPSLSPVQKRAWHRQRQGTAAKPQRTPEERARERAEERKKKAVARRRRRLQERERKVAKRETEGPKQGTPAAEREPGRVQVRQGIVTSATGDKTIIVRIDAQKRHRKYKKIVRSSSKLQAHDESNEAGVGDVVRVNSSRPLSKTKRWRLAEIVERAK